MKFNKDDRAEWTAHFMLLSGVALTVAGFIVNPLGEIHDSVLWYLSQVLVYAGSIFGIARYLGRHDPQ